MNILSAIDISNTKECICIVGAGGKTSTMFRLANELREMDKKVIITTTTKIYYPYMELYDNIIISRDEEKILSLLSNINSKGVYVIGSNIIEERKLKGIEKEFSCKLFEVRNVDCVVIECDGAKGKSIKAPADFEPVLPACATKVLGVIGLDVLGQKAHEAVVHRLDEFCNVSGCKIGEYINIQHVVNLVCHPQGIFKDTPVGIKRYLILNKADNKKLFTYAMEIMGILENDNTLKILIAQMTSTNPILNVRK